ncbi:MAG: helix-turn-helix domain-containing protein [Endozoicomonas sp.]
MKAVDPITDDAVKETLREAIRHGPYPYLRERAQAVLLSSRGYSMQQMARMLEVQYQTVSRWIDEWDDYGLRGLYKGHNGGRSAIYTHQDEQRIQELVAEEPRRLSYVQAKVEEKTGKLASKATLSRVVKNLDSFIKGFVNPASISETRNTSNASDPLWQTLKKRGRKG